MTAEADLGTSWPGPRETQKYRQRYFRNVVGLPERSVARDERRTADGPSIRTVFAPLPGQELNIQCTPRL